MNKAGRIAVIGDIGGHLDELVCCLARLGADGPALPADLTVIQCGDLVHRGPDSAGVVGFVKDAVDANHGRWIQLAGNHEAHYLGGPKFDHVGDDVDKTTRRRLRDMWDNHTMRVAAAVRPAPQPHIPHNGTGGRDGDKAGDKARDARDILVTHAGLCGGLWQSLGCGDAATTAVALNQASWDPDSQKEIFAAGAMLDGPASAYTGPLWAGCTVEVYPSLDAADRTRDGAPGFDQVHGHSTPYRWGQRRWRDAADARWSGHIVGKRLTQVVAGGRRVWGVDPALGRYGGVSWEPLVFYGRIVA